MTLEAIQDLQRQAETGRRAAVVQTPMEEYLDGIKDKAIKELEQELISSDRMETLQNRLYVIRALKDCIVNDIANGKVAEKQLREVETNE